MRLSYQGLEPGVGREHEKVHDRSNPDECAIGDLELLMKLFRLLLGETRKTCLISHGIASNLSMVPNPRIRL